MAKPLLTDELWSRIEPLLPAAKPRPKGGRPPVPNRAALTGILFVLRTGCSWEYLPPEMGCGSGMTCWRRLRDWHAAGIWRQVWLALLDELGLANEIDWDKVVVDSCSVRALFGGRSPAPTPLGGAHRPQPHGSREEWLEAACCLRWSRNAVGDPPDGRQRS